ncbi:hypothetical protein P4O66_000475 [Electrophorus voltai]|uniref:Reverse transcriptase domain-containing protein n=1 Tax=Electrophorus voltai TaxID=2609070 RepID=A0AAD8ZI51_9TELE|nr:hypothetical protein P4O66_000475 [Electrophorus voltai]
MKDCREAVEEISHEILQLLTSSNPTTCPLDPIPSVLFQKIARDLLPFISVINNSLSSGYVPTAFKTARVVPILKKATLDSSSVTNYRLNQLHDPNQSGYKPAHSTETALIAVTEKLHAAKAAKLPFVLILLDLSSAFDTMNHNILLSVLSRLGVTGSAWRWFQSYLEARSYQVSRLDIASWMTAHHLKFNLSKTEFLYIPAPPAVLLSNPPLCFPGRPESDLRLAWLLPPPPDVMMLLSLNPSQLPWLLPPPPDVMMLLSLNPSQLPWLLPPPPDVMMLLSLNPSQLPWLLPPPPDVMMLLSLNPSQLPWLLPPPPDVMMLLSLNPSQLPWLLPPPPDVPPVAHHTSTQPTALRCP